MLLKKVIVSRTKMSQMLEIRTKLIQDKSTQLTSNMYEYEMCMKKLFSLYTS